MRRYELLILDDPQRDIREIKKYIVKRFGQSTWAETNQSLKHSMNLLRDFPESGDVPKELDQFEIMGFREIVSTSNRIIYNISKHRVVIHLVADTRRDLVTLLNLRLFRM